MIRRPLIIAVLATTACAELARYDLNGQCGNHIIEPSFGETCDGDVDPALACGEPGTRFACRFTCSSSTACPSHSACGADGLCRSEDAPLAPELLLDVFSDSGRIEAAHLNDDSTLDLVRFSQNQIRVRYGHRSRPLQDELVVSPIDRALGAAIADFDDADPFSRGDDAFRKHLAVRGDASRPFQDVVRFIFRGGSVEALTLADQDREPVLFDHPCSSDPVAGCAQLQVDHLGDLDGDRRDELGCASEDRNTARPSDRFPGFNSCSGRHPGERGPPGLPGLEASLLYLRESDDLP